MTLNLYWVTTADHHEDWFIVAANKKQAERFHEESEGYDSGDATAEQVAVIPAEVIAEPGWPSDAVLLTTGATFLETGRARVVEIGGRRFSEGLLEETIASLADDAFEARGEPRVNATAPRPKRTN